MVQWVVLGYVGVTVCWWWCGGCGDDCVELFWFYLLWPMLEVEGEIEEKEEKKRNGKKKKRNKKEYLNKIGKK